jgi:hypothetical protein
MKVYNRIVIILGLTGMILSGCGKDDPAPSQEEKQLNKLSDTWVVNTVTMDGGDVTSDYSSFELTLSGSANSAVYAYGVIGRPLLSPWPSGGTWTFGSDVVTDIRRDPGTGDQLQMNYTVTDTQLTIEFSFSGTGYNAPARVNSAAGNWIYTFARKKELGFRRP